MSWASNRRTTYGIGVAVFLLVVIGGPVAYIYFSEPPTCTDGKRNQGESGVDIGGPCPLLDPDSLSPVSLLWARSFRVRDGAYSATAMIHNPNRLGGVRSVAYRFGLYDSQNVLVAERVGRTYIMPGTITPIFEGAIDTGQRVASRTQFEFIEPFIWERLENTSSVIRILEREIIDPYSSPRLTATIENTSVLDVENVVFIATVSSAAGNAFASSKTTLERIPGSSRDTIVFTWPDPFAIQIGSIEITALVEPVPPREF